ncbi:MAG: glycosyltransferase family 2 protein [Verrucomicrobiota bacterium]
MKRPRISICIVTYLRDEDLIKSVARIEESDFCDYEILIVDNAGSNQLRTLLEAAEIRGAWRLIRASENLGCANLNLLFPDAVGEIIVCFDDDSYPRADCLGRVSRIFEESADMGMIGFKMHVPETGDPWSDPWWNPDSAEARPTVLCPGCGLAFRNDPRLPSQLCIPTIVSQAHELSMAAEIVRLGYRIEFRPECVAYHPDTTKGYFGAKAQAGNLNQLRFLIGYSDWLTLQLLVLTHWIAKMRGLPNQVEFIRDYRREVTRRSLPRRAMRRFRDVLLWHIHRRLRILVPS